MSPLSVWILFLIKKIQIKIDILLSKYYKEKLTIIAVGDSWLNLTLFDAWNKFKKLDTVDWMKYYGRFNIIDAAIPGYTLINEVKCKLFRTALLNTNDDYAFLLSFGGNDITSDFSRFIEGYGYKSKINKKLLKKVLTTIYFKYLKFYLQMINAEARSTSMEKYKRNKLHFFIHGYDYFRPEFKIKGKYHNRFECLFYQFGMTTKKAITITHEFVDITNNELRKLSKKLYNLHYIDLRGTVEKSEWVESIHPNSNGYAKIANKITSAISQRRMMIKN